MCNFGRGHYKEHFCKNSAVKEMSFKDVSIYSSGVHFAQSNGTDCVIEGFMGYIPVNLFKI